MLPGNKINSLGASHLLTKAGTEGHESLYLFVAAMIVVGLGSEN